MNLANIPVKHVIMVPLLVIVVVMIHKIEMLLIQITVLVVVKVVTLNMGKNVKNVFYLV